MPDIVILTGGIGSGKSVVAGMLRERGIPVYDSDSRTKDLYSRDPSLVPALEKVLGVGLRGADGQLDRALLASLIFSSDDARSKLEKVVYPLVFKDFLAWKAEFPSAPFVVLESAVILSRMEYFPMEARVVLVDASRSIRLQRTISRDGSSAAAATARMSAQPPIDPSLADAVIDNSGTLEHLASEVDRVFFPEN
jgi:dephospho-CoA kinase